ncbi:hypothetical protein L1987_12160 [Smallanthus sonchifolius]|uniref:Uncharacterized protein n=1 Tax=Smallanthus sonchifolius TaxID=185202 RepID=A0ACB9JDK6_9ASTR|nr:hypothetical protein L1987_12160 [Smallanthus sonchifolius]
MIGQRRLHELDRAVVTEFTGGRTTDVYLISHQVFCCHIVQSTGNRNHNHQVFSIVLAEIRSVGVCIRGTFIMFEIWMNSKTDLEGSGSGHGANGQPRSGTRIRLFECGSAHSRPLNRI